MMTDLQKLTLKYAIIADVLLKSQNPFCVGFDDSISDTYPKDDGSQTAEEVMAAETEWKTVTSQATADAAKIQNEAEGSRIVSAGVRPYPE